MAYPTLGILDNFNRADADPDAGSLWGAGIETAGIGHQVVSNQAALTAGANFGSLTALTYGPDCEVYCTVATLPGSNGILVRVLARLQETGGFSWDGYEASLEFQSGGNETLRVREILNQSPTSLASDSSINFAAGDKFGLECRGTALKLYSANGGGAWTQRISTTDGTYTTANYLGLIIGDATARVDDFGGGTIVVGFEQEGYRWRNDDGSESTATWLAAQDTNITRVVETNTRLRLLVNAMDDPPAASLKLQYRDVASASGEWHDLGG